ncbi:histidine phosphatase family protein [Naasia lichenicola]|uniref:Histidine phosphatase family protein n=1 Tax=Naasia lichenicola TaxID=2565933 RepID=A0A4S4FK82_9MICO|nr:histidine phosphatase family protein [Naasia lichenicola]THG30833.1 histidine phosphatase family protein [Naasia lichenicola]
MPASQVHLVRHGEVDNPRGVLYGRLPGFGLSTAGREMAAAAADHLLRSGHRVTRLLSSPLERAVESAEPVAAAFDLEIETRDPLIEAFSRLEGGRYQMNAGILFKPGAWRYLVNPFTPSWGEPFVEVAARMRAEMDFAWRSVDDGDVVIVSHQLPIWMAHRSVAGQSLAHDPRKRRCALSSITSFENRNGWTEVDYADPASSLRRRKGDVGAV